MISIEVLGQQETLDKIAKLEASLNLEQLVDQAASILIYRIRLRYLEKKDPDYVPWPPSAAGLRREALGGPGTLYDTGHLFRSIQLYATGDNERAIGTDVEYAPYVQAKRIFLGFGEEDGKLATDFILERIAKALQ